MSSAYFLTRDSCPVCSSSDLKPLYECPYDQPPVRDYLVDFYGSSGGVEFEYLRDARYTLAECRNCELIFQCEIPNDALMTKLYEQWIDPKSTLARNRRQLGLTYYAGWAQEVMQIIATFKKAPSELDVFDFGMGWSQWALMAQAFGCNVFGTELSQARLDHASAHGITVIGWDDIPGHRFDFINAEQVFEHLADPLSVLVHLKGGLKDNGLLKISVPTALDMDRRLKRMDWKAKKWTKKSLNAVAPLEHINFYRRRSLATLGALAGMREVVAPLHCQYAYTVWTGRRRFRGNLLNPIRRSLLKTDNYVFFTPVS